MSSEVLVSAERGRSAEAGRRLGQKAADRRQAVVWRARFFVAVAFAGAAGFSASGLGAASGAPAGTGTIKGRVRIAGNEPGNRVIRMGMDPMCAIANQGKRPVNEVYLVGDNNSLGNVFLKVEGSFPATPVPSEPVVIDQRACFYQPRMVGARVGQLLRVRNSDNWLHNVHSDSGKRNSFNQSTPKAGMQVDFKLRDEEMLRIACDVHRWMVSWVGVVNHPYFAVSDAAGSFTIANVPVGTRTVSAWHEALGSLTKTVTVKPGETATVEFVYTPK